MDNQPKDVWPVSLEFTAVLALVILPFVGYLLGVASGAGVCR